MVSLQEKLEDDLHDLCVIVRHEVSIDAVVDENAQYSLL